MAKMECVGQGNIVCVSGTPSTTLRLNDSLKGFIGLRKTVILMVSVCYSKRKRVKWAREKAHGVKSRRSQTQASRCPLPAVTPMSLIKPTTVKTHVKCHPQKLTWVLCPEFLLGDNHVGLQHLQDLFTSAS